MQLCLKIQILSEFNEECCDVKSVDEFNKNDVISEFFKEIDFLDNPLDSLGIRVFNDISK